MELSCAGYLGLLEGVLKLRVCDGKNTGLNVFPFVAKFMIACVDRLRMQIVELSWFL